MNHQIVPNCKININYVLLSKNCFSDKLLDIEKSLKIDKDIIMRLILP